MEGSQEGGGGGVSEGDLTISRVKAVWEENVLLLAVSSLCVPPLLIYCGNSQGMRGERHTFDLNQVISYCSFDACNDMI